MPERLPDIICDTGFLMHMASGRIRNLDGFDLGNVSYVVPGAVLRELEKLSTDAAKGHDARKALGLAGAMRRIIPGGDYADRAILDHIRRHGGTVATTDAGLKREIKAAGGGCRVAPRRQHGAGVAVRGGRFGGAAPDAAVDPNFTRILLKPV